MQKIDIIGAPVKNRSFFKANLWIVLRNGFSLAHNISSLDKQNVIRFYCEVFHT